MKYIFFVLLAVAIFFTYCSKGGNNNSTIVHVNCDSLINDSITSIDSAYIIVPNVYSPNGDGINDVFFASYKGITTATLKIFDENNNLISTSGLPHLQWYSTDSLACPSGSTYYYRIQAKTKTGKNIGKCGDVLLVRHCIPSNISMANLKFAIPNDPVTLHTCP
jgi:gliding motility-associated-like protein